MEIVVRAIQAGLVWLTAVTTLIASVPHFECLCPNGRQKPFCLGIAFSGTSCCCGGSCCSSISDRMGCCQVKAHAPAAQRQAARCCGAQRQPYADSQIPGLQAHRSCCQKTFTADELVGITPTKQIAKQNLAERFCLPPALAVPVLSVATVGHRLVARHGYELPPPIDRIIALQHFLI